VVRACGVSDAGRVRKTNEDVFVADAERRLFAIADGMGGHNAGEVAARLAIDAVADFIRRSADDTDLPWPIGFEPSLSVDANRLRTAAHLANRSVLRTAASHEDYQGMGSTLVGLLVDRSHMAIVHVGDSRLYMVAGGRIEQMTRDDSWVETLLDQDPTLERAQLAHHPMRNVLTNVLGAHEDIDVHVAERDLQGGEVMLLCSDGVHGVLAPDALREILTETSDVELSARTLIATAMDRGSRDNVTAVVVRYEGDEGP
jgi:serine/threonine protein phosphatase PrpC